VFTTTAPARTIAHRGASSYAPENTLAAIRQAVDLRSDLVEVDVQRTRDGALVLLHDPDLTRTTDVVRVFPGRAPWRVADFDLDELSRLDAGSWFSPVYAGERIPTLEQAVDALHRRGAGLLLEVKQPHRYPGIAADIAAGLRSVPGYVDAAIDANRLVVQSFDHQVMRTFARLEPTIPVGLLGLPPVRRLDRLAGWASFVNPRHGRATAAYVDAVHAAGMDCLVWTVDDRADIERALDLGVDGVITNRPDVLERVLAGRLLPAA
jgi:glycerophosphoryl diester phosphodiesterase